MALISAERLHRWKCVYCGSKDKNIVALNARIREEDMNVVEPYEYEKGVKPAVKIVTCSQCGHTMIFGHSAFAVASALSQFKDFSFAKSEEFVKQAHDMNHIDPKCNPHNEERIKNLIKDKFKPIR